MTMPSSFIPIEKKKEKFPSSFRPIETEKKKQPQEKQESTGKSLARTALQIPQGIAEGTGPGLAAGLFQLLAMGESDLSPEEFHKLRQLAEEQGGQFDDESYEQARQKMLGMIPTVSNIGREVEERTGAPLEPKEWYQKLLRLGSMSAKAQPGSISQKGTAGVAATATSYGLQQAGVPEVFADPLALAVGGVAGAKTPKAEVSLTKKKPSGLPERQYEKLKEPRAVSEGKIEKINSKLEEDFRNISEDILATSPIEDTRAAISDNPKFKSEIAKKFKDVQELAESIPDKIHTDSVKKSLAKKISERKTTGFAPSEYEKDLKKFITGFIKETPSAEVGPSGLVAKYRENNKSLSEYFSPGESKAYNRAKKDALLEYNRVIADTIEKEYPGSEFSQLFKETNKQWADISDAESIDTFIDSLFKEGPQFKKGRKIFESENQARPFKRAMGEANFKRFEGLMADMLSSEKPHSMLKAAKKKGWSDLAKTGALYVISPKIAFGKLGIDKLKSAYNGLVNMLLDKPQLALTWEKGLNDLKKGDFAKAEKQFEVLEKERERIEALGKFNEKIKNSED